MPSLVGSEMCIRDSSLLSSTPPSDAERARPWRLHMRDGFCRRNHDPPLKCSDSSRRSTSLLRAVRCRKGSVPLWRLHFGTSGGLLGSVCSLLSSLLSLLSSLFSLLSSPCRRGLATPRSHEAGHPLASGQTLSVQLLLFRTRTFGPLCSLLSALFSLCPCLLYTSPSPRD